MTRIEICGGIATGKTSLARRLAEHSSLHLVQERYREMPFWAKFFSDPTRYALGKNVSFLLFHADVIEDHRGANTPHIVCDFAMFQDVAYASVSSEKGDLPLIEGLYHRLTERIGLPSAIVRLKCEPETQLKRISQRGRKSEGAVTERYLIELQNKIDERLEELVRPRDVPIVNVDTDDTDFVSNPAVPDLKAQLDELVRENINSL